MTFPGCRFELLEPIQKDGNDWELKIWLNPKLFNGSLLFEAIDYAFLLERASLDWSCITLRHSRDFRHFCQIGPARKRSCFQTSPCSDDYAQTLKIPRRYGVFFISQWSTV